MVLVYGLVAWLQIAAVPHKSPTYLALWAVCGCLASAQRLPRVRSRRSQGHHGQRTAARLPWVSGVDAPHAPAAGIAALLSGGGQALGAGRGIGAGRAGDRVER